MLMTHGHGGFGIVCSPQKEVDDGSAGYLEINIDMSFMGICHGGV